MFWSIYNVMESFIRTDLHWSCCQGQVWRRLYWHRLDSPPLGIPWEMGPLSRTPGAQIRSIWEACLSLGNRNPVGVCRKWHIFHCRIPGVVTCHGEELRAQQICDSICIERHLRRLLSEFRVQHQYLLEKIIHCRFCHRVWFPLFKHSKIWRRIKTMSYERTIYDMSWIWPP